MIFDNLKRDIIKAMRDKHELRKNLLRTLSGDCSKNDKNPDDATCIATIKSFIKKNDQLIADLEKVGNTSHMATALIERRILEEYLPKQLTEDEIKEQISLCKAEGYNLGQTMKHFKEKFSGLYDGGLVSRLCKEML